SRRAGALLSQEPRDAAAGRSLLRLRRRPLACLARAPDGDSVEPQRWLTDADGDPLAVLATGADPGIEREVVTDQTDPGEGVRTVADQHRALEWSAQLAVLDPVGLRALEHEFARGDIDLAATEIHGIESVLDRREDLGGITVAREHVGVGHARHRQVRV